MVRTWPFFLLLIFAFPGWAQQGTPVIFAQEVLTAKVEHSPALTPDGESLYFAQKDSFYVMGQKTTIYISKRVGDSWSDPKVAWFSGVYSDSDPFVAPRGEMLLFTSNRPRPGEEAVRDDRDIWYLDLENPEAAPIPFPGPVNSNESEYGPSIDLQGNLYFGSYRKGGMGWGDLWFSSFENEDYMEPKNLGANINTDDGEWGACISPDGSFLIYEASGRPENMSYSGDLWISYRGANGYWSESEHLGEINSGGSDLTPKIHGEKLYFASNRHPDVMVEMNNNDVQLFVIDLDKVLTSDKR